VFTAAFKNESTEKISAMFTRDAGDVPPENW